MSAIDYLSTSLNQNDDGSYQELAVEIIKTKRNDWVQELVELLQHKDKRIQSNSIKVLYEIGERGAAEMIAPYYHHFGALLQSKNNRLVWGSMIALDTITTVSPQAVYDLLPSIINTIDHGSVISIDHGVGILAQLSSLPAYSETTFPLLMEQLRKCPAKQLPMYAEKSVIAIDASRLLLFEDLLLSRMSEMERDSQKKD